MVENKKLFNISGKINIEDKPHDAGDISAQVYARVGKRVLASTKVDKKGAYTLKFARKEKFPPKKMELVVGPPINPAKLNRSNSKVLPILANEWKVNNSTLSIKKNFTVVPDFFFCLVSREIKICGIVCKEIESGENGQTRCCPVPYAKVDIYDVDSTLHKLDTPLGVKASLVLTKETEMIGSSDKLADGFQTDRMLYYEHDFGEVSIDSIYDTYPLFREDHLGEVYTDECGEFCLTFTWFPGCTPRIDLNPDLIFKVSQTVFDGIELRTSTIYAEGSSNTRWDVPDYHWVKLNVDKDVFVTCNPDCHPLLNRRALLLGVGSQEIYTHIEQGDDPARACGFVYNEGASYHKSPFGAMLDLRGAFGSEVEEVEERLYRISYAKVEDCESKPDDNEEAAWTALTDTLTDVQYYFDVDTGVLHTQSVALGPHSLPNHTNVEFFKIRNRQDDQGNDLHWKNQNIIARWATIEYIAEEWKSIIDDGLYVFKFEFFDTNGTPAADVIIGDDSGKFAHMFVYINNKTPIVNIKEISNAGIPVNIDCGSFEHSVGQQVKFTVDAYHPDEHLRYWKISYQVGYGDNMDGIDQLSDGSRWGDPLLENFKGKVDEDIIWSDFDADLGIVGEEPSQCNTFGISITLAATTKTIDGYKFLDSKYGHYQEVKAGLAVYHNRSGE